MSAIFIFPYMALCAVNRPVNVHNTFRKELPKKTVLFFIASFLFPF